MVSLSWKYVFDLLEETCRFVGMPSDVPMNPNHKLGDCL